MRRSQRNPLVPLIAGQSGGKFSRELRENGAGVLLLFPFLQFSQLLVEDLLNAGADRWKSVEADLFRQRMDTNTENRV
jgi:hypothetical protein